jgi:hypothetical protein
MIRLRFNDTKLLDRHQPWNLPSPGDGHDWVEGPVLVADKEAGGAVKGHLALVVKRVERVEVLFGHRKQGHVLDVRIVLHVVAGEVVNIVGALQGEHGGFQTSCN